MFAIGHEVGDMAIRLYGRGRGSEVEYGKGNLSMALATTSKLMTSGTQEPIFEATLEHEGVLVREDVLLPTGGSASWRIVEVKASTKVKPEHVQDCAIQAWVHQGVGYALDSISLAHIDIRPLFIENISA